MKHVVSVSLGSSTRDSYIETELLAKPILIERRGTDGDMAKAAEMLERLAPKVDAFGLGGVVLFIQVGKQRYYLREALKLAKHAQETPTVCGAGLKATLERTVVKELDKQLDWKNKKVLMVSGVENFGMAEALDSLGANLIYADLIFFLGLPAPLKSLKAMARTAGFLGPIVSQLPIRWLYPTGAKQESSKADWRSRYFDWADVISGDFHLIRRYLPKDMSGKIILTQTTTPEDVAMLRERGLSMLITTTPRLHGRSLSTNMLEAAFVALAETFPLSSEDYERLILESGIKPDVQQFS